MMDPSGGMGFGTGSMNFMNMTRDGIGQEQIEGMARHLIDSLEGQGHSSGGDMRQVYDWAGQIVTRRQELRRAARDRWAALEPDQEPGRSPRGDVFGDTGFQSTGGSTLSPGAVSERLSAPGGEGSLGSVEKYL